MRPLRIFPLIVYFIFISGLSAQIVDEHFPETDGDVRDLVKSHDTLFIGGTFTRVYSRDSSIKNGVQTSLIDGTHLGKNPMINDKVLAAVDDGNGGFIVGGVFSKIGDSARSRLGRIDSLGNILPLGSGIPFNGDVNALARKGDTLFVGGSFSAVEDLVKPNSVAAAMNLSDNSLITSFPDIKGQIWAAIADKKGGWIIAGNITQADAYANLNIIRLDSSGTITPCPVSILNADFPADINSVVTTMDMFGDTIFIGSASNLRVNGVNNSRVAAFSLSSGNHIPLGLTVNGGVYELIIRNSDLLVRGVFDSINTTRRVRLGAVNINTLTVTAFNPNPNNIVSDIEFAGDTLFVGGKFTNISGTTRLGLASYRWSAGTLNSLAPANGATSLDVRSLAVLKNTVYVSGLFSTINGNARKYFAAFNTLTSALRPWSPVGKEPGKVLVANNNIWIETSNLNGMKIKILVSVDTTSGTVVSNSPRVMTPIVAMRVSGSKLLFLCTGQGFTIGKTAYLAAIRISTNTLIPLSIVPDDVVLALHVHGNTLYMGGRFTSFSGSLRTGLAAYSISSNTLSPWVMNVTRPAASPPDGTVTILAGNDSTLYIGGSFYKVGTAFRDYIASVKLSTGMLTNWDPVPDDYVASIAVNNKRIYVNGGFSQISSNLSGDGFAVYDAQTETFVPHIMWFNLQGNIVCWQDKIIIGNSMYDTTAYLTKDLLWNPSPTPNGTPLAVSNNRLFTGGNFIAGGVARTGLASILISSGKVTGWNPYLSTGGAIEALLYDEGKIYAGGLFSQVGGVGMSGVVSINSATGVATPMGPGFWNGTVNCLEKVNGTLYVGGSFTMVGPVSQNKLAAINLSTNLLSSAPLPYFSTASGYIKTLLYSNNTMFAGGSGTFTSLGPVRNGLFAFSTLDGSIKPWNPNTGGLVYDLERYNQHIIVGGNFSVISSQIVSNLVTLDTVTGTVVNGPIKSDYIVTSLAKRGNMLYLGTITSGMRKMNLNTLEYSDWEPGPAGIGRFITGDGKIFIGLSGGAELFNVKRQGTAIITDTSNLNFLPVKWGNFSANLFSNKKVGLKWQTFSQVNCKDFTAQRSSDARNFTDIFSVAAREPNSTFIQHYEGIDDVTNETAKTVYYRIRQMDFDGGESFSPIASVRLSDNSSKPSLHIYPNPSSAELTIDIDETGVELFRYEIYNLQGVRLSSGNVTGKGKIGVPEKSGMYYLKVTSETGKAWTSTFIRQ